MTRDLVRGRRGKKGGRGSSAGVTSIIYTSKRSILNLYIKRLYASNNPLSLSKSF